MHLLLPILNSFFLVLYATDIGTQNIPPNMIVFKGIVKRSYHGEVLVSNFKECLVQCEKSEICQFVYGNGRCLLGSVGTITPNPDGEWVGMKNVNETEMGFCPAGTIYLTYKKTTKTVTTEYPSTEASTSEEPTTPTTPKLSCPSPNWLLVKNEWCIMLTSLKEGMTKPEAVEICKHLNTTVKSMVSGLEYIEELDYLKELVPHFFGKPQPHNIGVWVDGHRVQMCIYSQISYCFPGIFHFNDGRLEKYRGYEWYPSSPEAFKSATCVQVMFPADNSDPRFGKVLLAECDPKVGPDEFMWKSVLCGTPAL